MNLRGFKCTIPQMAKMKPRAAFKWFHANYPNVYLNIVREAKRLAKERDEFPMHMIASNLRYPPRGVKSIKIPSVTTAYYGRMLIKDYPSLEKCLTFQPLRS